MSNAGFLCFLAKAEAPGLQNIHSTMDPVSQMSNPLLNLKGKQCFTAKPANPHNMPMPLGQ